MYSDDPLVMKALPNGYEIDQLTAPFTPDAYKRKIQEAEQAGFSVCIIDSLSHEWEGIGGCTDIAENNKLKGMPNWAKAKIEHKKLVYYLLSTPMTVIACLRAREKSKPVKINGKEEYVNYGIQPITEKNFVFEMLLSLLLDEQTHHATPLKVPKMLADTFPAGGKLLTKDDGERIRLWNETGRDGNPQERLAMRARAIAEQGMDAYQEFFGALGKDQQRTLKAMNHEENKRVAAQADADRVACDLDEFSAIRDAIGREKYYEILGSQGIDDEALKVASPVVRQGLLAELHAVTGEQVSQ